MSQGKVGLAKVSKVGIEGQGKVGLAKVRR